MSTVENLHAQGDPLPGMPGVLRGKVAIITGASRGIGATAAHAFAEAGATVVLAARDEQTLAKLAQDIRATGGQALAVPTDSGDPPAVERLVQRTLDAYGRLDVAFNNASEGHMPTPLADIAIDDFDQAVRGTLRGIFLSMKYEIPAMLAGGGGAIVNMSSTAGLRGVPGIAGYVAAKHGVIGLTETAVLDYAARHIRVNALAPGTIATHRLAGLTGEAREQFQRTIPMQRFGLPEEVAALAVWLCSDQASFITGATFTIDGGKLAGGA
ncbi:MAG TPA: glucose 1-dehydrogenase [Ktedonobacterales bacterium]|nr:glucose 1-dehydrogenase [Ktedonobacterales bacterium]